MFSVSSFCLSRACLGKRPLFIRKFWRERNQNGAQFLTCRSAGTPAVGRDRSQSTAATAGYTVPPAHRASPAARQCSWQGRRHLRFRLGSARSTSALGSGPGQGRPQSPSPARSASLLMMFNLQRFLPDVLSPDCLVNENHRFYMNMAQKSVLSHRVGTEAFAPDKLHEHQRVDNALDRAVREETLQQSFFVGSFF